MVKKTKKSTLLSQWLIRKCTLLSHSCPTFWGVWVSQVHRVQTPHTKFQPQAHSFPALLFGNGISSVHPVLSSPRPSPHSPQYYTQSSGTFWNAFFFCFFFFLYARSAADCKFVCVIVFDLVLPIPTPMIVFDVVLPVPTPTLHSGWDLYNFWFVTWQCVFSLYVQYTGVCTCSIQVYVHEVYRHMYMKYTGTCSRQVCVHEVCRCMYMLYTGVHAVHRCMYMIYTGVCACTTRVCIHEVCRCMYMLYAGVWTWSLQVYMSVHALHVCTLSIQM